MKNVSMMIPDPTDATSFYRSMGVLPRIKSVNFKLLNEYGWNHMQGIDLGFMQRPFHEQHLQAARVVKMNNIPLWVDHDDYLPEVEVHNPAFHIYGDCGKNFHEIVKLADVVTVSTQALKDKLDHKNVQVIPNAFNDYLFKKSPSKKMKHILWRGSSTHNKDLMSCANGLVAALTDRPDWKVMFMGFNPWFIIERLKPSQYMVIPPSDIIYYFNNLKQCNASISIVPLTESTFNHCKSNIAWLEASYAGAAVLAPDWEEWKMPGVSHYRDEKEFHYMLSGMMDKYETLETGWKHIESTLLLSQVNAKRNAIINQYTKYENVQ